MARSRPTRRFKGEGVSLRIAMAAVCLTAAGNVGAQVSPESNCETVQPAQNLRTLSIRLVAPLGSDSSRAGDAFVGTLAGPLVMGDRIVAQRDAVVTGIVRRAVNSGGAGHAALLTLVVRTVETRNARYSIETLELTVKEDANAERNVVIVGGSADSDGAGGLAGSGRQTALGDASASGAAQSAFLNRRGEIRLPENTLLTFYLSTRTINPKQRA
jgi:hypothetical protein